MYDAILCINDNDIPFFEQYIFNTV